MGHMPGYPTFFGHVGENTCNVPVITYALNNMKYLFAKFAADLTNKQCMDDIKVTISVD